MHGSKTIQPPVTDLLMNSDLKLGSHMEESVQAVDCTLSEPELTHAGAELESHCMSLRLKLTHASTVLEDVSSIQIWSGLILSVV